MDAVKTGDFLRDLRKERNLTQEELGEQLGVTNKTVSRWENGVYFPPVEYLIKLGEVFGVTVNEILAGARLDSASYQPKAEENIVTTLKRSQKLSRGKRIAIACCSAVLAVVIAFAIFLLVLVMLSYHSTKQTNCFVEGIFTNDEYKLFVTAIDEETYRREYGTNVVEDKSVNRAHKYYEIALYRYGKENESDVKLNFTNLTFSTVTTAEPCFYEDVNGNSISPQIFADGIGYSISYNGEFIFFFEVKRSN